MHESQLRESARKLFCARAFESPMEQETVLYTDRRRLGTGEDGKIYLEVAFSLLQVTAY